MGTSVSTIVKVATDGDQHQDNCESDYGSMEERVSMRVITRGYRHLGHDLCCNGLYSPICMIL